LTGKKKKGGKKEKEKRKRYTRLSRAVSEFWFRNHSEGGKEGKKRGGEEGGTKESEEAARKNIAEGPSNAALLRKRKKRGKR